MKDITFRIGLVNVPRFIPILLPLTAPESSTRPRSSPIACRSAREATPTNCSPGGRMGWVCEIALTPSGRERALFYRIGRIRTTQGRRRRCSAAVPATEQPASGEPALAGTADTTTSSVSLAQGPFAPSALKRRAGDHVTNARSRRRPADHSCGVGLAAARGRRQERQQRWSCLQGFPRRAGRRNSRSRTLSSTGSRRAIGPAGRELQLRAVGVELLHSTRPPWKLAFSAVCRSATAAG